MAETPTFEPTRALRPDEPCGHRGCLNHVTHPCEGCGRIAGRYPEPASSGSATPTHDPALDWPEDFAHENGDYLNFCHHCKRPFRGHKRRVTCKLCAARPSRSGRPAGTDETPTPDEITELRAIRDELGAYNHRIDVTLLREIKRLRTALAASREDREKDAEAMLAAVKAVEEVVGCGDHSCLFKKPSGMGTNGGCRCHWKPMVAGRLALLYRVASAFASSDKPTGSDA